MSAPGPDTLAIGLPEAVSQNDGKVLALGATLGEQAGPSQEAQERLAEMPLPQNLQSLVLMGMFALLILFALYFTAEVVLPIIFAIILYLVLQPAMRGAARLRIPKAVAALLIEQTRAPSLRCHPRPLGRHHLRRRVREVAHDLPTNRWVSVEEPLDDWIVRGASARGHLRDRHGARKVGDACCAGHGIKYFSV